MFDQPLAFADFLNAREKAGVLWNVALVLLLVIWIWRRPDMSFKELFGPLIRPMFWSQLTIIYALALAYFIGIILLVQHFVPWNSSSLKSAIIWVGTGFLLVGRALRPRHSRPSLSSIAAAALKITIAVEFVVALYFFSFALELVLIPVVSLLLLSRVVTEGDPNYASVDKLLERLLGVIGIVVLLFAVKHVVSEPGSLFTVKNGEEFIAPFVLTLFFLPLLYFLALASAYERLFLRITWAVEDPQLARRAKLTAVCAGRLRLARVDDLVDRVVNHWNDIESIEEFKLVLFGPVQTDASEDLDDDQLAA